MSGTVAHSFARLSFATIHLYAAKPLDKPDTLGRPCQCDRCVAILACQLILEMRRAAA